VLAIEPRELRALMGRASVFYAQGEVEKALHDYAAAIANHKDFAQAFNDYAWLLATGTKDGYRDGAKAVDLANEACRLTEWKNGAYLDTLAAAYAEKGDFAEALKWQKKAVEFAKGEPEEVQRDMESRVALYERKEAYREAAK
jgi:Tfp pilus assembly protein PilF